MRCKATFVHEEGDCLIVDIAQKFVVHYIYR